MIVLVIGLILILVGGCLITASAKGKYEKSILGILVLFIGVLVALR